MYTNYVLFYVAQEKILSAIYVPTEDIFHVSAHHVN